MVRSGYTCTYLDKANTLYHHCTLPSPYTLLTTYPTILLPYIALVTLYSIKLCCCYYRAYVLTYTYSYSGWNGFVRLNLGVYECYMCIYPLFLPDPTQSLSNIYFYSHQLLAMPHLTSTYSIQCRVQYGLRRVR